jgi:hypothetical protein
MSVDSPGATTFHVPEPPRAHHRVIATAAEVGVRLRACFFTIRGNFPIGGAAREFPKAGDQLPLEIRIAGQKALNFPVEVTQIEETTNDIDTSHHHAHRPIGERQQCAWTSF